MRFQVATITAPPEETWVTPDEAIQIIGYPETPSSRQRLNQISQGWDEKDKLYLNRTTCLYRLEALLRIKRHKEKP